VAPKSTVFIVLVRSKIRVAWVQVLLQAWMYIRVFQCCAVLCS